MLLAFRHLTCLEDSYRYYFASRIADVLADELAAELLGYDLATKTWSLRFVVEVHTIDSVLVCIQCQVTTNTAPKTSTVEFQYILGIALDVSYENWSTVYINGIVYQREVECSRIGVVIVLVECYKDLLLLVKQTVRLLTRAEHLAYQSEQYRHDYHDDRCVNDGVHIAIGIQTFFLLFYKDARLFAYRANLRCLIAVVNIATNGTYKFLLCHIH